MLFLNFNYTLYPAYIKRNLESKHFLSHFRTKALRVEWRNLTLGLVLERGNINNLTVISKVLDIEKKKFCANLACQDFIYERVCGFRSEGEGFRLKLFENECELLKYGCNVDDEKAYGLINKEYCEQTFEANFNKRSDNPSDNKRKLNNVLFYKNNETDCNIECIDKILSATCGIRKDGPGFRIRNFESECDIDKYNCENDVEFTKIDNYYCENDIHKQNEEETVENDKITKTMSNATNLVVVNAGIIGDIDNINDTIDTFFAASHVFDLPVKEVTPFNTRRRRIKIAGPVKVFVPWIVKPDVISNDTYSIPTLSSCYHRCPTKCPDTYAPVCGVPGIVAREPSIMFQNHCFMDVAQCKMFWENKSYTSQSSSYVEASFLFCMGDEMNAVYRFLPAIRTLQHMGRLKKKGKFRARLRNFRYVSDFRSGRPKFMG